MDQLAGCLQSRLPLLSCTLQLREEFRQEVTATPGLLHVDDPNWPGIGVVRYVFILLGHTRCGRIILWTGCGSQRTCLLGIQ